MEETTETQAPAKKTWHDVEIVGNWRLVYKVKNNQGPSAFGGYHLGIYPNPFTGERTYLKSVDGDAMRGWMMSKMVQELDADESYADRLLISWLICHPEITVDGVKNLDPQILKKKSSTVEIHLICLNIEETDILEEEDYIDKLIGLLSLEGGKQYLGLTKLRYILAALDMNYREPKYEPATEKKALRSRLKGFARKSIVNARNVNQAIEDISLAQNIYEFKEMVRFRILVPANGIYKFRNAPVGSNFESVAVFFENHPEVKAEALMLLNKELN